MTPGQRIKEERLARQWSQQKLADEIGKITKNKISRAAIALWEGGGSKTQKSENLLAAAQVLGLSPQWLLSGAGDKHQAYIVQSARDIEQIQPENQAPSITREQQQILDLLGRMDSETGALFIRLFDRLVPDRRKKQAKEGARARAVHYGVGESVRRGDLFEKDESIGRTKNDGDTF